jgi:hypothetical protein
MARAMQACKDHDEMFASMAAIWGEIALSESSTNIVVLVLLAWGYTMFKVSREPPRAKRRPAAGLPVAYGPHTRRIPARAEMPRKR